MKESGPYWVNGMLPLAYQLEDERLLKDVRHFMDYVLAHQQEDGWIGPTEPKMLWTRMLILHAITVSDVLRLVSHRKKLMYILKAIC